MECCTVRSVREVRLRTFDSHTTEILEYRRLLGGLKLGGDISSLEIEVELRTSSRAETCLEEISKDRVKGTRFAVGVHDGAQGLFLD